MNRPGAMSRLSDRIAVITGASRGIGAAVAKRFAAEGAHVVAVARREADLTELDDEIRAAGGATPTLVPLDLTDGPGIDRLGGGLADRHGRLDILIGNAGVLGTLSPLGHIRPEVWDRVIEVNLTANWRLIRSLDPLLRASDAGRAVFVSSGVASRIRPYWGAYAVSKAAVECLAKTYALEVAGTAIRVNAVNPGAVRTGMRAQAMPGEDPQTLRPPEAVTDIFVDLAAADCTRHGEVVDASNMPATNG